MADSDDKLGTDVQTSAGDGAPTQHPVRRKKKRLMVLGIIVAVIVIIVIAFTVWHNTPGFCNAICHEPMDTYVESYHSGDAGMLVTAHAKEGVSCLDCHEARLGE